jgi:hypothetical protein
MQLSTGAVADSGDTLSRAGNVIQKTAQAKRSKSLLSRAASAVSALTLAARLYPGARRLVKRNPLLGTLLIVGTVGAIALVYSRRVRA